MPIQQMNVIYMKKILLFGAGKSATCLIHYLIGETASRGWELVVAENNLALAQSKIGAAPQATARALQVENEPEREHLIREADIVISLLPPTLHYLVCRPLLEKNKDLLTPSYLAPPTTPLEPALLQTRLLSTTEM